LILSERARDILCIGAGVGFTDGGRDKGETPAATIPPDQPLLSRRAIPGNVRIYIYIICNLADDVHQAPETAD
jgi:hypothetical protein